MVSLYRTVTSLFVCNPRARSSASWINGLGQHRMLHQKSRLSSFDASRISRLSLVVVASKSDDPISLSAVVPTNQRTSLRQFRSASTIDSTVDSISLQDKDQHNKERTKTWLVVGDGDLSYSASSRSSAEFGNDFSFIATVLEDQETHHKIYSRSKQNTDTILGKSSDVQFGVDATQLSQHFPDTTMDRIDFNFPHWRGKQNNRYNRQLLDAFLKSASGMLTPNDGEIRIALRRHQGGMDSKTLDEWKQSWLVPQYAADHGLVLDRVEEFETTYTVASYRGEDRPFRVGDSPQRYIFKFPSGQTIDERYQISCRHELRLKLDKTTFNADRKCPHSWDEIVTGDAIIDFVKSITPAGIRSEVINQRFFGDGLKEGQTSLAAFWICYTGESQPLPRSTADKIRDTLEHTAKDEWGIALAKGGAMVSRPFPFYLLPTLRK